MSVAIRVALPLNNVAEILIDGNGSEPVDSGLGAQASGVPNLLVGTEDDANADENDLIPLVLEIPNGVDLAIARITFSYNASLTWTAISDAEPQFHAPNTRRLEPSSGGIRIWTHRGNVAQPRIWRDIAAVNPGHLVASGTPYGWSHLQPDPGDARSKVLYVEGIHATEGLGDAITVALDPDGDGPIPACSDTVRVQVVDARFVATAPNSGFDHTINPAGLMVPLPAGQTNAFKTGCGHGSVRP